MTDKRDPIRTDRYTLIHGDCITEMAKLPANSVDAIVTDPPYGIRFMGKAWDGADIEARAEERRNFASKAPDCGPNGGHDSLAAEAGKYDLAPSAMRAFQEFSEEWAREAFRVLKPGGHLLSFASARTYHRMACGIEDAGFEVRDQAMWLYGSGFPKSLDVSKAIDKAAGAAREVIGTKYGASNKAGGTVFSDDSYSWDKAAPVTAPATDAAREWEGWGTALKPAHEPICVARKPLVGTVAANVLQFGTGALNIDGCRVHSDDALGGEYTVKRFAPGASVNKDGNWKQDVEFTGTMKSGRWPANLIHDGSEEVLAAFPDAPGQQGDLKETGRPRPSSGRFGDMAPPLAHAARIEADKSAARFFYCAKASRADRNEGLPSGAVPSVGTNATMREREDADWETRNGNFHPTVKPTDLMAYLCRLVTPPGGVVLDPFMGSGSTGKAAVRERFQFIGIELDSSYLDIAVARIAHEQYRVDPPAAPPAPPPGVEPPPQFDLFGSAA